jgi:hypothetical protein
MIGYCRTTYCTRSHRMEKHKKTLKFASVAVIVVLWCVWSVPLQAANHFKITLTNTHVAHQEGLNCNIVYVQILEPWRTDECDPWGKELTPGATVEYKCTATDSRFSNISILAQCSKAGEVRYQTIRYEVRLDPLSKNRYRIVDTRIEPY